MLNGSVEQAFFTGMSSEILTSISRYAILLKIRNNEFLLIITK